MNRALIRHIGSGASSLLPRRIDTACFSRQRSSDHMSNHAGIETNLDILRSMAVLSVFASHLALAVNYGRLNYDNRFICGIDVWTLGRAGVLLFFVHTSLVLMLSMERMAHTGWTLVWRFYVRRLFRIYPLSIVCCVLVSVFSIPRGVLGDAFVWSWRMFASNVLLIQNLTDEKSLTAPLWSLPYEVQMYLALPFIFLVLRTRRVGVLLALVLAAVLLGWRIPILEFAPCFLAGVCAYFLLPYRRAILPSWIWPILLVSALLAYCLIDPSRITARKSWTLCMIIGLSVPFFQDYLTPMIAWASKRIARYSYGIYLSHLPLMWIFFRWVSWPTGARYLVFAISGVVLPILAYHLLEKPLVEVGVGLTRAKEDESLAAMAGVRSEPSAVVVK